MMSNRVKWMVAAVTALSISSAWGQDQMSAGSMQESVPTDQVNGSKVKAHVQHGSKPPAAAAPKADGNMDTMPGMNHDKPSGDASTQKQDMSGMDHGSGGMDSGDMQMQGGSAPPDARDPHAWSGGYTLGSGPYALPGQRQLRLADERNFAALLVDRLERVYTNDGNATAYDALAWFGRDYDRLVLKAHGSIHEPAKMIFTRNDYASARTKYAGFYSLLEGVQEIARHERAANLRWIGLARNQIGHSGAKLLTQDSLLKPYFLDVRHNDLGAKDVLALKSRFPEAVVLA